MDKITRYEIAWIAAAAALAMEFEGLDIPDDIGDAAADVLDEVLDTFDDDDDSLTAAMQGALRKALNLAQLEEDSE